MSLATILGTVAVLAICLLWALGMATGGDDEYLRDLEEADKQKPTP